MYANYDESRIGYIQGGKSGWIPESGYCLTSYSQFYEHIYVVVTCDAYEFGSQLEDHNAFYNFLFENMHEIQILSTEEKMGQVHLLFQDNPEFYEILNPQDVSVQVPIVFEKEDLTVTYDYIDEIITPVKKDTPIGLITFSLGDQLLYETTYLFQEDIERNNLMYTFHVITVYLQSEAFLKLLMVIGFILFILLIIIFMLVQYRKRQKKKDNYKGYKL